MGVSINQAVPNRRAVSRLVLGIAGHLYLAGRLVFKNVQVPEAPLLMCSGINLGNLMVYESILDIAD